jgi:UTP--glucose-1-phosphate uridylyltransferase
LKVRKAVLPVAGFGTRFLPATKAIPKALLPVLDTPPIHHAVREASEAGIEHVTIVLSQRQDAIGHYFGRFAELESALERTGKAELLELVQGIPEMADISYVYQHEQRGLGHAVLSARPIVGDEPFALLLPDDVILGGPTEGMIEMYAEKGASVIALREVPDEMVPNLGIVEAERVGERTYDVRGLVEKPALEDAPSNLAIIGRYVLTPQIFEALSVTQSGAGGEIQITDAMAKLLEAQSIYGYEFPGVHFDVGTPLGLLKASVHTALQRKDLSADLRTWLEETI